jgi:hypothetical protein
VGRWPECNSLIRSVAISLGNAREVHAERAQFAHIRGAICEKVALPGWPRPAASAASAGAVSARSASFRYHAEETADAHILKKHPGRMNALFCRAWDALSTGPSRDRGGSVRGLLDAGR